ncbi:MAG: acetylornithine/succinylornithine family transaminase [Bacteroidetes bacterium]|nr:MAG: acetylornithine/succinylornithine family transaminase [Bacteroidota bacterium]
MSNGLIEREKEAILQTYKRLPIEISKAEGCWIEDIKGNKYLDFLGGIAVNALGHSHPAIIHAIKSQLDKFMHVSNYFYQEPQIKLAEKLKDMTGFSKLFFSNSGTEAVEGAIKLARRWGNSLGKTEMFGFSGGFHGRTYGSLSLMDKPLYKDGMGPFLPGMNVIPYNDIPSMEKNLNENTIAVIIEFLQGEGGIISAKKDFIDTLFELKKRYNFLIIADEVQTGVGRTGKFLSYEHYGAKPDIVTMAKGLGGGLPLGAILVCDELKDVFQKGMHGTTYGGNAVACSAGYAVLQLLENGLLEQVGNVGDYLNSQLNEVQWEYPNHLLEIRGKGLIQGILLDFDASELVDAILRRQIITNAASGKVLRLVPPLIVTDNEVSLFVHELRNALAEIV